MIVTKVHIVNILFLSIFKNTNVLSFSIIPKHFAISRIRDNCMTMVSVSNDALIENPRLQRARLRLAEAQGIIPIGASENPLISLEVNNNRQIELNMIITIDSNI